MWKPALKVVILVLIWVYLPPLAFLTANIKMDADRNKATETPACSPGVAAEASHSNQHSESWRLIVG